MASTSSISAISTVANGTLKIIEFTYAIDASGTVYFEPEFDNTEGDTIDFSGYASMQLINTGAANSTLTVQVYVSNNLVDADFLIPWDPDGVVHPAMCTALAFSTTPKKMFENIKIPLARRVRWAFTEASGAAAITGKAQLALSIAKVKG